jgi:predicted SAM-dependent methyltransferase
VTPVYLNLASGTDVRPPPWRNLDCVAKWPLAERACDEIWDARTDTLKYDDNSVSGCYMGYTLLHIAPRFHERLLRDVYRVLKPGATLQVGEVDMRVLMDRWLLDPHDAYYARLIWGEQGYLEEHQLARLSESDRALQLAYCDQDKHCHGFTWETLTALLYRCGFKNPRRVKIHGEAVFYEMTCEVTK